MLKTVYILVSLIFLKTVQCYSDLTYSSLVEAAFWCQVSYCILGLDTLDVLLASPPLETGPLPEACPTLQFCQEFQGSNSEIVKLFGPTPYIAGASATGYIALDHEHRKIIVAWKGSTTARDWIEDFDLFLSEYQPLVANNIGAPPCKNCRIHIGVYGAMASVADEVFPTLVALKKKYPHYSLLNTGHSLGGGLSSLAAAELQLLGLSPTTISLAALKPGDPNYFKWVDNIYDTDDNLNFVKNNGDIDRRNIFVNVEHKADLVPLLPPSPAWAQGGVFFNIEKIELPHPKSVTHLVGKYHFVSLLEYGIDIEDAQTLGEVFEVYGHNHYFISVYGCNSSSSLTELIPGASSIGNNTILS